MNQVRITQPGTYSEDYGNSQVQILTPDPVVLDRCTAYSYVCANSHDLTIRNSISTGSDVAMAVWRFVKLRLENNKCLGGGMLAMDFSHTAQSAIIRCNQFRNVSGAPVGAGRKKVSAIQFGDVHCPEIIVEWNAVENERGKSATEDAISLMRSGGVPTQWAEIRHNFVSGVFAYPAGAHSSGSGIMMFDPGAGTNVTVGGYANAHDNVVCDVENQQICIAGGHDLGCFKNLVVNDGVATPNTSWGIQEFNWENKTPPLVNKNISIHDNRSCVVRNGRRLDYSFHVASAANNAAILMTSAQAKAEWLARVAAANITVGPLPEGTPATSIFDAMKYADVSPGIRFVPTPAENIGPAQAIGWTVAGTWAKYAGINFGAGVSSFAASVGCDNPSAGGSIEVRLDNVASAPIGSLRVTGTGNWYSYSRQFTPIAGAVGLHDVYLTFRPLPGRGVGNVLDFSFAK